jgi:hypothetical protein
MENPSKESHFIFWQRWLFYTSLIFVVYGILLAFFANTLLFKPYNKMIASILWQLDTLPQDVIPFRDFICGPFGGTIACSYILLAYIAHYPFLAKQKWARNAITLSFGIWFIIDSTICFKFKVYPQIYLINIFSLVIKALPLIFTWKEFR